MTAIPDRVRARFWSRVDLAGPDDCWPCRLSRRTGNYRQIGWSGETGRTVTMQAHRVAWELTNGPIPDDLTIDHICHNPPCCNPRHLRLLPVGPNARDNGNARKTHCNQGHAFTPDNTLRNRHGHRICRTCKAGWRSASIARGARP